MTTRPALATTLVLLASLVGRGAAAATFRPDVYFPLDPGNFWVYEENGLQEVTIAVLSFVDLVQGAPTTVVEASGGSLSGGRLNFTNDGQGLRLHKLFEPGAEGGTAVFRPPVLLSPPELEAGVPVNSAGQADLSVPGLGTFTIGYSATHTVVAEETVGVPLGVFDAVRLQSTLILSGTILGRFVSTRTDGNTWLAAHVGEVKDVSTTDGETMTLELVRTNVPEPSMRLLHLFALVTVAGAGLVRHSRPKPCHEARFNRPIAGLLCVRTARRSGAPGHRPRPRGLRRPRGLLSPRVRSGSRSSPSPR